MVRGGAGFQHARQHGRATEQIREGLERGRRGEEREVRGEAIRCPLPLDDPVRVQGPQDVRDASAVHTRRPGDLVGGAGRADRSEDTGGLGGAEERQRLLPGDPGVELLARHAECL